MSSAVTETAPTLTSYPTTTPPRPRFFRRANAYTDIQSLLACAPLKGLCLDLPAGRGVNLAGIRAAGFKPLCADLFPAKTRADGSPCLKINFLGPLPFAAESLEAILCSEGIEHHSSQTQFLADCARVLKPGGILLITTPNILSFRARLAYLFNGQASFRRKPLSEVTQFWQGKYLGHVHLIDYFRLRFLCWQAGLRLRVVTTAKYSLISMLLAPFLYLPAWCLTRRVFRKSHREQPEVANEICRHALSLDLLLGKKLIVVAEKPASGEPVAVPE